MLRHLRGMAICHLPHGVLVVDGSGMGMTLTSLTIALSGSFADSFLQGRGEYLPLPSPAVIQQTDFFLPQEARKGIGLPRLDAFQNRHWGLVWRTSRCVIGCLVLRAFCLECLMQRVFCAVLCVWRASLDFPVWRVFCPEFRAWSVCHRLFLWVFLGSQWKPETDL